MNKRGRIQQVAAFHCNYTERVSLFTSFLFFILESELAVLAINSIFLLLMQLI
jgi:hypothetical protein